jgi:hypothetical protein
MATDATLTRQQKNFVLQALQEVGFDGSEFRWENSVAQEFSGTGYVNYSSSCLFHVDSNYYFRFGNYVNTFSPGANSKVEIKRHDGNWTAMFNVFDRWPKDVLEEVSAPDLWATVGRGQAFILQASSAQDNSTFTAVEQGMIAANLDSLQQRFLEQAGIHSRQDQIREDRDQKFRIGVERSFQYLKDASRRVGRKDWTLIAFSILIGQALQLAETQEGAHTLMNLAASVFQWIVTAGQHLLPPLL